MCIVRLRTPARVASFVLTEWVPVALVLTVVYSSQLWVTFLMLVGNFALYECGYLVNDLADSVSEPNGDHLEGRQVNLAVFWTSHLSFFAIVIAVLYFARGGKFALTYGTLAVLVLMGFLWHTSRRPRSLRFLRIFTFAILYLYKFSPVVVPQVPLKDAQWLLVAIFLCWGLWRFVFYILGKLGGPETCHGQDFDPLRLLHPMSLFLCAPLLLAGGFGSLSSRASTLLWIIYAGVAVLRSSFQLSQWKLVQADWTAVK